MCCAPRLLHFWLPMKAQNPENNSLPRKVKKNGDLNMIDFTVFETNLKKSETLQSNNQHCNEKTTNRWNWTTFAIARNSGNKKVYIAKWKKNSGINNTFQNLTWFSKVVIFWQNIAVSMKFLPNALVKESIMAASFRNALHSTTFCFIW